VSPSPTLLGLHGLGGDRSQPLGLIDEAVEDRHQVVAPDLRAHGSSTLAETPALLSFAQLAEDVEALVGRPPAGVILLGISMGASVVLELVARGRIPVRGVVLVRPAWRWRPHPPNLAPYPRIAALLRAHGPQEGKERFRESDDHASVAAVSVRAAEALSAQFDEPRAVERAARLERMPASAPTGSGRLGIPGVILASERDPVHPTALAEDLATDLGIRVHLVAPRYEEPERHVREVAAEVVRAVSSL
jgi:pimeloyl-ACP methyl ester carboxylesterase